MNGTELPELLLSFLTVGLFSIGGGYATIPLIQNQVVSTHGWLSLQEFSDIITISQMTPGPLAVNTSTFVGIKIAGIAGAVTATFGCVLWGFLISIGLYCFFQKYKGTAQILDVLKGLRAVSIGLIASSAGTILLLAFGRPSGNLITAVLLAGAFLLLRRFKWSPMTVMAVCGILGGFLF